MAKVEMKLPEEFLLKLSTLGDKTDVIIPKVLEAGGEVVCARVRGNLGAVIGRGTKEISRSTGELSRSLGVSQPRQNTDGDWNIKVGFGEPRSDGHANAKIATIVEYGKHGQPPKPFLKPAKSQSKNACLQIMKDTFEQEVESI